MTIKRSSWSIPYLIFLLIFVVLPLVLIAIYAFQDGEGGFTFENIARFFTDQDSLSTFALSLEVAIENTAICLLLGYPAAYILARKDLNRSAVTVILFILPMWINALMRTLATAELFNVMGVTLGKGTLLFGMAYDYLPFMIYPIYNTLNKMDKSYSEAAEDLGATPGQALRKVMIPQLRPGMVSGFILAFTMSLDDFAVTFFTRGTVGLDTLSTYIYTDARKGGLTPELRPLMTLIFATILILLVIINIRQARLAKKAAAK